MILGQGWDSLMAQLVQMGLLVPPPAGFARFSAVLPPQRAEDQKFKSSTAHHPPAESQSPPDRLNALDLLTAPRGPPESPPSLPARSRDPAVCPHKQRGQDRFFKDPLCHRSDPGFGGSALTVGRHGDQVDRRGSRELQDRRRGVAAQI